MNIKTELISDQIVTQKAKNDHSIFTDLINHQEYIIGDRFL